MNEIIKRGVMMTPGLAVDGNLIFSGKVPRKDELTKIFKDK
ncbi:MAG: thioredoxin family protein [Elusimicrobiota bacterium]